MIKVILLLIIPLFLFAHKINLFLDYENKNLFINSYFANAKACVNCKFEIIDKENNLIFTDNLDKNGEYNYKTDIKELSVVVDAGSGHKVVKTIEEKMIGNQTLENEEINSLVEKNRELENKIKVLEEQLNYFEIIKVLFGLVIIFLIFFILKRVKK